MANLDTEVGQRSTSPTPPNQSFALELGAQRPSHSHSFCRRQSLLTGTNGFWSCQSFEALGTCLPTGQAVGSWTMSLMILPGSMMGKPSIHLHLDGLPQLSCLSSAPSPCWSHLFLQLDHSGLGIAQSLVQDLNVPPMVLARVPHCCQLHFQLFLFLQEFFVWKGKKSRTSSIRKCSASGSLPGHIWQGLEIKNMQMAVSFCCCCLAGSNGGRVQ